MRWDEFTDLLSGIDPKTPLGRIVAIRLEDDKEVLKYFTKEQHRIRNEWRNRSAKKVSKEKMEVVLEELKQAFISLSGGAQSLKK